MVRPFGLRRELVPHLDEKLVSLIDQRFSPLFRVETGTYELKPDAIEAFADCCEKLVIEIDSMETRLVKLYRRRVK